MTGTTDARSLSWLLDHTLPLNRKERYYTGTVLPGVVCSDDMAHLHRLTALMGHPNIDVSGDPADCGLVFFTEYGLAESVFGPASVRFDDLPANRDTPDVVFLTTQPTPVLFALEAKLYDRPSGHDLRDQLDGQAVLLADLATRLATWLDVAQVPVAHYALLPEEQVNVALGGTYKVLSWNQLHDAYADVAPAYWLAVLDEALTRYPDLVTRVRAYDDARLTGGDLVRAYQAGTLAYAAVGRTGGITGAQLRADIEGRTWPDTVYQVATVHPGNRNWFSVDEFISLLDLPDVRTGSAFERFTEALSDAQNTGARVYGEDSILAQLADGLELLRDAPPADLDCVAGLLEAAAEASREARREASDLWDRLQQP